MAEPIGRTARLRRLNAKLNRREFAAELAALRAECEQLLECHVSEFPIGREAQQQRLAKVNSGDADGFWYFARTYFPHYVTTEPSELHSWISAEIPPRLGTGMLLALAAPRGNAKSTLVSVILCVYVLVTRRKFYPLLGMDTFEMAAAQLEAVKVELESNPRLLQDFPDTTGRGRVWREGVIITAAQQKVEAFGIGKRIRGRRHGARRPDLLILDDIENDENVLTPAQRDKLYNLVMKSLLQLGPPDGSMDTIWVGTVLHYDAALMRVLDHGVLWKRKVFQAIVKWPSRMDLWDNWEELLRNEGAEAADLFLAQNRALMHEGAQVLWPAMQPLERLMRKRVEVGHEAFDSEYQNDPVSLKDAPLAGVKFWVHVRRSWIYFGACDPSMGKKAKQGDPAACLVGGYCPEIGELCVVDARIARMKPSLILETVIAQHQEYQTMMYAIEAWAFQEYLRQQITEISARRGIHVPTVAFPFGTKTQRGSDDKALRIMGLQPHIDNGLIKVHSSQRTLLTQMRRWPKADHDDGPDAVDMLWQTARRFARGVAQVTTLSEHERVPDETRSLLEHY